MAEDKKIKKSVEKVSDKDFDPKKYIDTEPTLDEMIQKLVEDFLTERKPLTVQQRRKRGLTMRRYKNKIAMARKRASRKKAPKEVLVRRSRKKARDIIKQRLMKSKNYSDMSASQKMAVDKRLSKISPAAIDRLAKRQLPKVRSAEMQRLASRNKNEGFDINDQFEIFVEEMSCGDNTKKSPKRYHNLLTKENSVKIDKRFKIFKPKTNKYFESADDFSELNDLIEAVENLDLNEDAGSVKHTKKGVAFEGLEEKTGLWANIHAKRKRIEKGSGEKMRKPGSEGAPTAQDFKDASESVYMEAEKPGLWANIRARRKKGLPRLKPGQEGYPKTLDIEEWMEGLDLLDEAGILDKAIAAIHKNVLKGVSLNDITWDVSRAAGVNMTAQELQKAYVNQYGNPKDAKKSSAISTALKKKYGFKSEELDRILDEIDSSKASNREQGTDSLVKIYKKDTPGQKNLQEVSLDANIRRGDMVRFYNETLASDDKVVGGTFVGTDADTGRMRIRDEDGKLHIIKHTNVFSE